MPSTAALMLGLDFSRQSLGQRGRMLARWLYFVGTMHMIDFGDPQLFSGIHPSFAATSLSVPVHPSLLCESVSGCDVHSPILRRRLARDS